ncbi:alpha/beta fold hydrolase [Streptomyces sp. NPDC057137]|uniref:alpha/beta fold hydrolase n=1 Tax=Streptomyces sp. NPDC057137 TaxID=3346030 RepID=UPI003632EC57
MTDYSSVWLDLLGLDSHQRFYDVGGVRTRSIEAGEGPAMIFLHGAGGHAETWSRNLPSHAAHRRCFAIDMLGHGFTDAPEGIEYTSDRLIEHVVRFMDTAGIDRADFCGESHGGRVAAWMAIKHPDRVSRLVLNTTGGLPVTEDRQRKDVAELIARTSQSLDVASDEAVRARVAWLFADPALVPEEFVKIRQAIYRRPGVKRSLASLFSKVFDPADAKGYHLTPERAALIEAPTLVVWTDHNPIHNYDDAREHLSHIPNVRFHLIEGAAHWPQYEQAATYNEVELGFLLADDEALARTNESLVSGG